MKCPCCSKQIVGYLHVIAVDVNKFNYVCADCLAEHLRIPLLKHVKFAFTEKDKEEIRKIVREEIENWKTECSKALDKLIEERNKIEKHWLRSFESSIK